MFKKILVSAALMAATAAFAADLPSVKILATGGTIAGTAASSTQTTGYKAGDLGIQTLIEAVRVASTPEAKGKGVMIVMNDEINGARDVTKTNTTNPATFKSPELGAMGYVSGNKVRFYKQSTKRHTTNSEFDVSKLDTLPRVDIIYSHVDDDRVMADAAVAAGAKGIIHAGTGNGSIANPTMEGLKDAVAKGVVVVRSARVPNGATTVSLPMWTKAGFLESDTLNPQKARLLLQLALTKTQDPKEIQRMFDQY